VKRDQSIEPGARRYQPESRSSALRASAPPPISGEMLLSLIGWIQSASGSGAVGSQALASPPASCVSTLFEAIA
jgi:hypothetical protein